MRGLSTIMNDFYDENKSRIDFVTIYITEAHASNEWPINSTRYNGPGNTVAQPTSQEERRSVAELFVKNFGWRIPLVCDDIQNFFEAQFSPWPLRFYVVEDGKITYIAQPKNCEYDIFDLFSFLLQRVEGEGVTH